MNCSAEGIEGRRSDNLCLVACEIIAYNIKEEYDIGREGHSGKASGE